MISHALSEAHFLNKGYRLRLSQWALWVAKTDGEWEGACQPGKSILFSWKGVVHQCSSGGLTTGLGYRGCVA